MKIGDNWEMSDMASNVIHLRRKGFAFYAVCGASTGDARRLTTDINNVTCKGCGKTKAFKRKMKEEKYKW